MPEFIGEWIDAEKNILALAVHLDAQVRRLEERRARIASGPNAPELRANDLAAIDAELEPLSLKAKAAAAGKFLHDPRDVAGCDPQHSRWIAMAIKSGRYVTPEQFGQSVHDTDRKQPIKVIRGGSATNMGSPSMATR